MPAMHLLLLPYQEIFFSPHFSLRFFFVAIYFIGFVVIIGLYWLLCLLRRSMFKAHLRLEPTDKARQQISTTSRKQNVFALAVTN